MTYEVVQYVMTFLSGIAGNGVTHNVTITHDIGAYPIATNAPMMDETLCTNAFLYPILGIVMTRNGHEVLTKILKLKPPVFHGNENEDFFEFILYYYKSFHKLVSCPAFGEGMTNTRANARRGEEGNKEQEVPLQVPHQAPPQASIDPPDMSNAEIRSIFLMLSQAMTTQVNREVVAPANPIKGVAASRVREFLRMNPLEFCGTKLEEDPKGFIEEVYKVLAIMGVTMVEKVELAAYQLKNVSCPKNFCRFLEQPCPSDPS
ncbi:hypothetical protein MTR67_035142 [Solanum verrucosum]|uniref:Gag-pol polyprotein n=1 Tax=Solanum verrucosum TaxID=315347 RepID=A0AAF0U9F4_SOLVR|nr:hypothetical protein MTR67_035142 [Solanum verrucosum]